MTTIEVPGSDDHHEPTIFTPGPLPASMANDELFYRPVGDRSDGIPVVRSGLAKLMQSGKLGTELFEVRAKGSDRWEPLLQGPVLKVLAVPKPSRWAQFKMRTYDWNELVVAYLGGIATGIITCIVAVW